MVTQLVKKFPVFCRAKRSITMFTTTRHWSLSWARWTQFTSSHPTSLRSILIYYLTIYACFPSSLFPSGFPIKILYALIIYPMRATCSAFLILLDLITLIISGEVYKLRSYSTYSMELKNTLIKFKCTELLQTNQFNLFIHQFSVDNKVIRSHLISSNMNRI
jgi:hypothetical protein